ncbi:MAG: ABC transporter permease [Gemmatimonadaceae bacterium]
MSLVGRARNWLRSIVARRRLEREMLEEMATHIDEAAERFRASGLSERDALLAARREFGHAGVVQEEARDARGARWVDSIAADLRFALRQFSRRPLTTVTIVLTLTLGIGATASMFSVTEGVFNRPPPGIPDDAALVLIRGIDVDQTGRRERLLPWPEVTEYAAQTGKFSAVAAWTTEELAVDVTSGEGGTSVRTQFVSPNIFGVLGVRLAHGPGFVQTRFDDVSEPELTAVVSHAFAEHIGGAAAAVGKHLRLNGVAVQIVGVTPPRFNGPNRSNSSHTVWLPVSSYPVMTHSGQRVFATRDTGEFRAVARVHPTTNIAEASAAVNALAAALDVRVPTDERRPASGDVVRLRGETRVRGISSGDIEQTVISGVVVLLVLLVCTTSVSSLLIGAAESRRAEIGVRLALGASRARVARQLLTENAILAVIGGALGLMVFAWVCRIVAAQVVHSDIVPDWTTAGFTLLSAIVTTILCGLSPALHATRSGVATVLKQGAPGATSRSRLQRAFVVAQIALTQPLLVGLMVMMSLELRGLAPQPGSAVADRLLLFESDNYPSVPGNNPDPMPHLMQRLAALPGVIGVVPELSGRYGPPTTFEVPGEGSIPTAFRARVQGASPDYFRMVGVRVVMGREFAAADTAPGAPARVIIGTASAARLFGAVSPPGQRLFEVTTDGKRIEHEIVGVVASDQLGETDDEDERVQVFLPYTNPRRVATLLIRTSRPADELIPSIQEAVRAEAPRLPLASMRTLERIDRERRRETLQAAGASVGGGMIVLLLASIGLYAVVAIAVGQRRREIGVRVAVGASPRQVVAIFFNAGLRLCLVGLGIGLPLSWAAFRILGSQLTKVAETNVVALVMVIGVAVVAVASLATWLPARKAAGVDPLIALRAQ